MSIEGESHINPLEALRARLGGYFDGKIDEIEKEIEEVNQWPQAIRLGSKIKRKDQELLWLFRLKDEMQSVQAYVNASVEQELEK